MREARSKPQKIAFFASVVVAGAVSGTAAALQRRQTCLRCSQGC
jgi:hypothetical protein